MTDVVACGCCGVWISNTPEENTAHGQEPYPYDTGIGMCVSCGGDPALKGATIGELEDLNLDEEAYWKRIGAANEMFFRGRIELVRENLRPDLLAKFEAMSLPRKIHLIGELIERGAMI